MRPVIYGLLALVLLVSTILTATAGEDRTLRFSIEECIEYALEHNTGLLGLEYQVESTRLEYDVSLAAFDPVFSANIFPNRYQDHSHVCCFYRRKDLIG